MTTDELKSQIRRIYDEAIGKSDYHIIDELFSKDVVLEDPTNRTALQSRDAFKHLLDMYRQVFPDGRSIVEDLIVENNKVAVRGYRLGTHQGEFMGLAPTGKEVRVPFMDIWQLSDNEIIRGWSLTDAMGMLEQLGVHNTLLTEVTEEYSVA